MEDLGKHDIWTKCLYTAQHFLQLVLVWLLPGFPADALELH